jgi:hypothetical protein
MSKIKASYVAGLEIALKQLRHTTHYECDDSWYSCPKSANGCADDRETGCNCGLEDANAIIDAALAAREVEGKY